MSAAVPAVVFGIDTPIGLTIVRDLGRDGVTVYGVARSASALGMASRYLHQGLVRASGEQAIIDQLVQLGRDIGPACLFAISEGDLALLNRHRDELAGFTLMFPDPVRLDSVLDKSQTFAAAAKVGIRTPKTLQVASMAEAQQASGTLRFPVVLKWANPIAVIQLLSDAGLELEKLRYCDSPEQLLACLQPFDSIGSYPLIQEYCAGYGLGQFILMKEGQAHYTFQHKRVHEWPPEGGFSSLCESIGRDAHQDLMQKSIALLRELNWEGIAMVEYRHDPATGESALMEINGRFWGSLPLAYHAGARFPSLYYRLFGTGQAVANTPYRGGVRCRFMVPETRRLLRILLRPQLIADKTLHFARLPELLGYLGDFVRLSSRYYVFELADPKPFFSDVGQMIRKALKRL